MLVYQRVYIYMNECDQKNSMVSSIHLPTWWATFCRNITCNSSHLKKMPCPKRKGSSSNHQFSVAFAVSFRDGKAAINLWIVTKGESLQSRVPSMRAQRA